MRSIALSLMLGLFSLPAIAESPNDVVAAAMNLLDQEIKTRKKELSNDKQALYAVIDDILLPRFDRKYAARLVLALHWRTASDAQKTRFIEAFYTTLVHRYADGILEFDLEKMEILPYRGDESKDRTTVKTKAILDDGTEVPVHYAMAKRPQGWLMYDVKIEGISYIRNFRVEFKSEINATSLDAVIERLEAEAAANPEE
ncbi:MAG: ABC transporter substrate-binding protein [Gammaproteobacteria bacterium]|nr:ABC transporter substrate-binding protein [Gammaproteobacteria bacterium]